MNKINKIIAILSSIFLVTSMFSACNKKLQVTDCIYIGITNSDGITDTKMYLKQRFPNTNISIVDLNLGGNDCFKNVQENIYNLIKNKQLDMVIGIPEDYVSSQHDIFMDISSCISNDSVIKSVINHCSIDGHIFYITDSLYCSRFMVCNKNLLPNVTIKSLSDGFENINDMYSFFESNVDVFSKDSYLLSLGSPIDEFLYDDIANLLTIYGFPRTEFGQQKRFANEGYISNYKQLYDLAQKHSYLREKIGFDIPLDFEFCLGDVVCKVSSLYELYCFHNGISNDSPFNTKIESFEYSINPIFMHKLVTQSTVSAISKYSEHKNKCIDIISYLLTDNYSMDLLNEKSPWQIDTYSLPIVVSEKVSSEIAKHYGQIDLQIYDDYTTYKFVKSEKKHWDIINQEQLVFQNEKGGENIINALQKIET